jgi:hypothetical protein
MMLPDAMIRLLQDAAHESNVNFPATPAIPYVPAANPSAPIPGNHC